MRRPWAAPLLAFTLAAGCHVGPLAPDRPVEVVRDELGFTHIYAKSDRDALFAAGYAQARDRLLQMEIVRRQAYGRLAELVGAEGLRTDRASRTMNFARWGRADAERARAERPEEVRLLDAWANGVNRRIAELTIGLEPWPPGFDGFRPTPWSADDVYVVGKLFTFGLSSTLDNDVLASVVLRVVPGLAQKVPLLKPAYDTFILESSGGTVPSSEGPLSTASAPPARPGKIPLDDNVRRALAGWRPVFDDPWMSPMWASSGSNNWAVSGRFTDSGKPYVVGDPHQPVTQPNRLWPVHLSTMEAGGTFDTIGFTFGGTPFVELGHTRTLGWTATTNFADVMDLWDVEAVGDTDAIRLGGETRTVVRREERIRVRRPDARYGDADEELFVVRDVPGFGVLLPEEILPVPKYLIADGEILFDWTGFSAGQEAGVWLALDRARTVDDFERAIDLVGTGAQNFTAADANEISYRVHGDVPDRGPPSARPMPWHIQDGGDPATLWTRGLLGAERMPRLREPPRGILFSANNDPFGFTEDGVVENDPFYWGGFYAQGFRARRLEERLGALLDRVAQGGAKVSRADLEDVQHDRHSLLADRLLPALAEAIAKLDRDPALATYAGRADLVELAGRLARWDRRWTRDSHAAALFLGFSWFAARRAIAETSTAQLFDQISEKSPPSSSGCCRTSWPSACPAPHFLSTVATWRWWRPSTTLRSG